MSHNDTSAEALIEPLAFVKHWDGNLTFEADTGLLQFTAEAAFVDSLQQSLTDFSIHVDRQSDHAFRQWLAEQHNTPPWPSVVRGLLRDK